MRAYSRKWEKKGVSNWSSLGTNGPEIESNILFCDDLLLQKRKWPGPSILLRARLCEYSVLMMIESVGLCFVSFSTLSPPFIFFSSARSWAEKHKCIVHWLTHSFDPISSSGSYIPMWTISGIFQILSPILFSRQCKRSVIHISSQYSGGRWPSIFFLAITYICTYRESS